MDSNRVSNTEKSDAGGFSVVPLTTLAPKDRGQTGTMSCQRGTMPTEARLFLRNNRGTTTPTCGCLLNPGAAPLRLRSRQVLRPYQRTSPESSIFKVLRKCGKSPNKVPCRAVIVKHLF